MDEATNYIEYEIEQMAPNLYEETDEGCERTSKREKIIQGCDEADCEDEQCSMYTSKWYGQNTANFSTEDIKGMIFDSWQEAGTFYLQYSKQVGFGIRKRDSQKNKVGDFRRMKWVCRKEGVRDQERMAASSSSKRQPRPETRVNCEAHMTVKLKKTIGKWVVQDVDTEHNHTLAAPQHIAFIPSHRMIDEGDKAQALSLRNVGVKTSQITELISKQKGGYHHMGFTHKDMHNLLSSERVKQLTNGDVNKAIGYFEAKKAADPGFYYMNTLTVTGELEHLFWADSISRMQYVAFGDVLSFDACYKRLMYEHAVIILVGVTNHDQSIIFGVALLRDEQMKSYVWLLNTFLDCMGGKKPISVVTDGCQSMRGAVKHVLHDATHRLCIWHIKRNACREVRDPNFLKKFELCIDVDDVNDFDVLWATLVQEHNLANSKWCQMMSNDKELWAECFLKGCFFGGLRTTSRCEGMHSYLRSWLSTKLHVSEFVLKFDDAVTKIRYKECGLEFDSQDSIPICSSALRNFEKHAADVYTKGAFRKFKEQLDVVVAYCHSSDVNENITSRLYRVYHYQHQARGRLVVYEFAENSIWCDCKYLESYGIPCRHQIYVMKVEGLSCIPPNCIVWRWTKEASTPLMLERNIGIDVDMMYNVRFGALSAISNNICRISSESQNLFQHAHEELKCLYKRMSDLRVSEGQGVDGTINHNIKDPPNKRQKSATARRTYKKSSGRLCGECRQPGHTRLKCPKLVPVGGSLSRPINDLYDDNAKVNVCSSSTLAFI